MMGHKICFYGEIRIIFLNYEQFFSELHIRWNVEDKSVFSYFSVRNFVVTPHYHFYWAIRRGFPLTK